MVMTFVAVMLFSIQNTWSFETLRHVPCATSVAAVSVVCSGCVYRSVSPQTRQLPHFIGKRNYPSKKICLLFRSSLHAAPRSYFRHAGARFLSSRAANKPSRSLKLYNHG